jgi:methionyl-tRNA formyltransferase
VTTGRAGGSRVRTVFFGSGHFGAGALRRLVEHPDVELVGVVTAPPRPSGRGHRPTPTDIDAAARELGVPVILTPERLRSPESVAAVLGLRPDLAVLADYGQLVPPALLDLRYGALNLHPSLLPRHRGATPIPAAILAGDRETGVTLMRMDEGLDTGPIVAQRSVELDGTETAPLLEEKLEAIADALLNASLGSWLRGEIEAHPQPETGATLTRPLAREDGRLDPTLPAVQLWRQVRAFQPWPGSFVDTPLGRLVVWKARVGPMAHGVPGRLGAIGIETVDGTLLLHEVQPAGGKRMSWEAYVRGRPHVVDSVLVPAR